MLENIVAGIGLLLVVCVSIAVASYAAKRVFGKTQKQKTKKRDVMRK
ncbi:hypothetical protein M4S82_16010 [Planococcus sp. MERTA32b]|nr:hypothetical protein [Planococcus sp. MER TA 32b]